VPSSLDSGAKPNTPKQDILGVGRGGFPEAPFDPNTPKEPLASTDYMSFSRALAISPEGDKSDNRSYQVPADIADN